MSIGCLILAGGKGTRLGMEKMYYHWHGRALWEHVYGTCKELTDEVVIVGLDIDAEDTRMESIRSGLRLIDSDKVIILDVARPLTKAEDLQVLEETATPASSYVTKVDGALVLANGNYVKEPDVIHIENPQCFETSLLKEAFSKLPDHANIEDCCELIKLTHDADTTFLEAPHTVHKITVAYDALILDALSHA